jgi:hypothetical protein
MKGALDMSEETKTEETKTEENIGASENAPAAPTPAQAEAFTLSELDELHRAGQRVLEIVSFKLGVTIHSARLKIERGEVRRATVLAALHEFERIVAMKPAIDPPATDPDAPLAEGAELKTA